MYLAAYAQYSSAVRAEFTPKGARLRRQIIQTSPNLVVFDGHVSIAVPSMWGELNGNSATARHSAFSAGWSSDLDAAIAASGLTPALDFRRHNPYTPIHWLEQA